MFIEVTEILRCPRGHDEAYLICGPVAMDGRDVVRGGLACPVCGAEFPIVDRVAWFAPADERPAGRPLAPAPGLTADGIAAFLDLQGGGGYLLLVGNAGRFAEALAPLVPRTALVCVNPPLLLGAPAGVSVLHAPAVLPVRRHTVRAAVIGADAAGEPWLGAAGDALLGGLRMVVEDAAAAPAGISELARGAGVFVGEKRSR